MLETLWYLLILTLQILQVNPQLQTERMQIDVYVASKPAYSFTVDGSAVQGQIINAEKRSIFGEYESTHRIPQAYVIFPREALPPELEEAAKSASGKDKTGAAATKPASADKTGGGDKPNELLPLTIDFTKALKQLVSFQVKSRQQIEYPEMDRFLGGGDKKSDAGGTNPDATTLGGPSLANPPKASTTTIASGAGGKDKKGGIIEIRQYSNRLVISADFIQTVIIVNFMQ